MELSWLTRSSAEVPAGDDWLGPREREVLARLRIEKRRNDWRLGRHTAKAAVAAWLDVPAARVEIVAADDGAPEAFVDGRRAPVSISLSHRADRAMAVVGDASSAVGCDLELIEPRSEAFVREWLAPPEQAAVLAVEGDERARVANLIWTAKEAAAKVRRGGLRLNVRHAVVTLGDGPGEWRQLTVDWGEDGVTPGWWRADGGWAVAIASEPGSRPPLELVDTAAGPARR
ncbi:MAG: 4'-phosphopantetheinyl transferase family protein [Thermoleophilaceae bacterium]